MSAEDVSPIQVSMPDEDGVYIRIVGRATSANSARFKELVIGLLENDVHRFNLSLFDCSSMDSTFIGVLAGMGHAVRNARNGSRERYFQLIAPNDRVRRSIENLGVEDFFVFTEAADLDRDFQTYHGSTECGDKERIGETSLQAHEDLCAFNPENRAVFKDVIEFMRQDLDQLRQRRMEERS